MFWEHSPQKESTKKATKAADPTTYSPLSLRNARKVGEAGGKTYGYPLVASDSESYVQLKKRNKGTPMAEAVVARLLKGVVNVSDVVPNEGRNKKKFYSKVMPLEKIEEPTSKAEVRADLLVFKELFGDTDHAFGKYGEYASNMTSNTQEKVVYYDFGIAQFSLLRGQSADHIHENLAKESLETVAIFKRKLEELKDRILGESGEQFMRAIVSGIDLHQAFIYPFETPPITYTDEEIFRKMHDILKGNLEKSLLACEERLSAETQKKAV